MLLFYVSSDNFRVYKEVETVGFFASFFFVIH